MTSSFNRFLVALCVVHIVVFVVAIYDPRATTTKPPERREAVPPWYLANKANESGIQATPLAPKWQTHDDVSSMPATKGWSPWRKNPGSEIEQRTQVNTQDYSPEQVPEQQHHPEFNKWEQQGNLKPSPPREGSIDSDKNRGGFQDASKYESRRGPPQNMIDFENKHPPRYHDTNAEYEDENLYEGVPVDSTKPRKENILVSWKPQHTVARYDRQFGVQCPDHNSTGQFVYPLDCKFFVNCWKGRAFVQPCAPGTYFNPDTLECDFPHKVKCYEDEFTDYKEPIYSESQVDRNSQKLQEPKCPPYVTGLIPHHGDCTKFLQCANGATYIMDCGPGTVFNPAVSVCDWPRNVKGCEDTFKSEEDVKVLLTPPSPQLYAHDKSKYTDGKKIACPADFTGLLPHPETCKKFLQCTNGGTFVMDCGPGTAFNPLTTVCDWPYNVPSCKTDKPGDGAHRTTGNTRPPSSGVGSGSATWSDRDRYNGTSDSRGAGSWPGYRTRTTTTTTTPRPWIPVTTAPGPVLYPTWRPSSVTNPNRVLYPTMRPSFMTTPAPRWIPTWTTARPPYDRPGHAADYPGHYVRVYEDSWYRDYRPYRPEWRPSSGDSGRPTDGDYGYYDRRNQQWTDGLGADRKPQGHFDRRPGQSWPPGRRLPPDHRYGHAYHPLPPYPSYLPHGYEPYGPTSRPPANPSWDSGSLPAPPADGDYGREYYEGYTPHTGDGRWRPGGDQHRPPYRHDHQHHYGDTVSPDKTDQRQLPPYFPDRQHEEDDTQYREDAHGETKFRADGSLPANRRIGYDFSSGRDHDGPSPGFYPPGFNRTSPPAGNVFLNSGDQFAENSNQTRYGPRQDGPPAPWPGQGNTAWNRPDESGFQPSTWRGQPSRGHAQTDTPTRPWDQDTQEDKFHQWQSGSDIYQQSTIDRENDAKMAQWASKTNIFTHSKGQLGPDSKNETKHPRTNLYPDGIYVNVNGVKGHFITKEIESNQTLPKIQYPYDAQKPFGQNNILNSTSYDYAPFSNVTMSMTTTTMRPPNKPFVPSRRVKDLTNITNTTREKEPPDSHDENRFHSSNVPIEQVDFSSGIDTKLSDISSEYPDIIGRETGDYVDVLDEKNEWKPKLVFKNKTETAIKAPSAIMRISPKKTDVELFNIEAPPFKEEEQPFPVYYVPSVLPLTHSQKTALPTPISGQVIRLRGGSGPNDGYVEVQGSLPGWGIVCDSRNGWTLKEAHIVCRQLGYTRGAEMAWQGRNNRNGVPTWIAANTVTCLGNETRFQSCKFTHNRECRVDRDAIGVRCLSNRIAHCRKDEIPHEGQCYHLAEPVGGSNRAEASDYCKRRNARLIDIANQAENNFVSEWLSQLYPEVDSIMTSGTGFTVMNHPLWLWEDSTHAMFKFTKWWPGWMNDTEQPPPLGPRPLCIVMKRKFPCHELAGSTCVADYFFWDTEDCVASSKMHSFVCERPYEDIGCVYGKGNQYAGKANVTLSGNECLPWADQRIAHQLRVNIVSEEAREKLRTHNFCRNPNPAKESRPWCFAGPTGTREYCDIPTCGNIDPKRSTLTGQCKPRHFECMPGECIPSPWVCDGEEDCTNGADERKCAVDLSLFKKSAKHKLDGYDVEKWLNTPLKTCALRCKEADFTCRSFNHKAEGNICLLSDSNIGLTGALKPDRQFDYYEMTERSVNCDGMYICNNRKCINQTQVCNGKNDCNDRSDESICTAENLDYDIRLAGTNNSHEGRVEVKVLGHWGQVCDDGFGMINADVICRELGFVLGALDVRLGGFYGNLDPPTKFMVDQLKCRGNETTLRECDFSGWGVHNCQPEEAVGIVCKTAVNTCQQDYWRCDNSAACISISFICDEVVDCPDGSDESSEHCDAPFELRLVDGDSPLQGRVEVRHHGVWGTVCDDDFTHNAAAVICRSLGYGGRAIAKKNGFFGPGEGPIWLDEVFCHGNETQLLRCDHNHWGRHNCNHNEDAGVICSPGDVNDTERKWTIVPELPEQSIDEILPTKCGQRAKDFNDDEDLIFAKVVHGSVASKGTYPWQASIRVRGHSRSNHWCGAVIVSPLHVLTAAHCLEGYNKGTYFVRAGDYNTDIEEGTEVEANIEDYYVHEEFRIGHKMNNDIALVLLKGPGIPLGKDIMPICLPPENTEYPAGLNCTISGFGSIETGKTTQSKDLRYGWVPLLDQSICRAGYVYGENAISDGMMCAGYLDEGIDTCDGDSGGPLACHHNGAFTLYGITSWGQHCGRANKPGVYVRVAYYRRWIDQKIKESLAGR